MEFVSFMTGVRWEAPVDDSGIELHPAVGSVRTHLDRTRVRSGPRQALSSVDAVRRVPG
jgi:hypothetical protein